MAANPLNPWRVKIGVASATTTQATVAVAHRLGAVPTFVLLSSSLAVGAGAAAGKLGWTATATTLTITKADTGASETISYMCAVEEV